MYSDWLIGVIRAAAKHPTDTCGGFCASSNGLPKIYLDDFPGPRGTGMMRGLLTSVHNGTATITVKNNTTVSSVAHARHGEVERRHT